MIKIKQFLMGVSEKSNKDTKAEENSKVEYPVYRARWLVLIVCCMLALSNSMQWIGFTSLTTETAEFYCGQNRDCEPATYTNQIFQLVAVITGVGGMYITDSYGIKLSILCGTAFNFAGSILRLVSAVPSIESSVTRQALLHSGSVVAATAQAFFLVLPSKIAEVWFPEDQRAISNVLTFIANPAGVALGTLLPSYYFGLESVKDRFSRHSWHLFYYNLCMAIMTTCTLIVSLFIRRGSPPTPPSPSNEGHEAPSFWNASKMCLKDKQFLVQMIVFALAFAELWSFMIIVTDITVNRGYDLQGYPTALCAIVGVVASLMAGAIADRTKLFKQIIRFCTVGFAITAIIIRLWLRREWKSSWDSIVTMFLCACLGAFSIPQFPIGVEMGVETTFPVQEATSSGLLVLNGQLWMFINFGVFEGMKRLSWFYDFKNQKIDIGNWQLALDCWCILAVFSSVLAFFAMNPSYKRILFEEEKRKTKSPSAAIIHSSPVSDDETND